MTTNQSDNENSASKNITVGFPLYPGCTLLDFAGASQVFAMTPGFEVIWLASSVESIKTTEKVSVLPEYNFHCHPEIDILFVPGGGADGVIEAMSDPEIQAFLKRTADNKHAQWIGSICTGAFVVAAAGLFNGCQVRTYWSQLQNLALFSQLTVCQNIYPRSIFDEDNQRFSGGGVSSSIDLALEFVERLKGKDVAETTQLAIQYAPDPPVSTGDTAQAAEAGQQFIVDQLLEKQQVPFIDPIYKAVKQITQNNS